MIFFFFFFFFDFLIYLFFLCFFFFVIIITVQICKSTITVSTQFLLLYSPWPIETPVTRYKHRIIVIVTPVNGRFAQKSVIAALILGKNFVVSLLANKYFR